MPFGNPPCLIGHCDLENVLTEVNGNRCRVHLELLKRKRLEKRAVLLAFSACHAADHDEMARSPSHHSRRQDPARAEDGVLGGVARSASLDGCAAACGGGLGQSRPRKTKPGAAVMSDFTLHSVETLATVNARPRRRRRTAPVEAGADLLKMSSRLTPEEARVLAEARAILLKLSATPAPRALTAPSSVREYLTALLSGQEREYFVALALDNRHRLLASEILFAGTVGAAAVYPREVVKFALRHNAAALVLAHGHPSGVLEPSQADELITRRLISALQLVEVRVLDHVVVGSGLCYSFAEAGRL
jgi:hypothetical protein